MGVETLGFEQGLSPRCFILSKSNTNIRVAPDTESGIYMKLQHKLTSKSIRMVLSFLIAFSQMAAYAQSESEVKEKKYKVHFNMGLNMLKCSLKPKDGYDQIIREEHLPWQIDQQIHYNYYGYRVNHMESFYSPGFSLGLVGEIRLNDQFSFQFNPSVNLGGLKVVYECTLLDEGGQPVIAQYEFEDQVLLRSVGWLEMPLLIKYYFKGFNKAYLIGGLSPRISISRVKISGFPIPTEWHFYDPFDLSIEFGGGYKIYKEMSVQLKVGVGLLNKRSLLEWPFDYWSPMDYESIESLRINQFQIGIVF